MYTDSQGGTGKMFTQRYEVTQPHGGTLLGWAASEQIARVAGPGTGPTMAKRWTWYRREPFAEVMNFVTRGTGHPSGTGPSGLAPSFGHNNKHRWLDFGAALRSQGREMSADEAERAEPEDQDCASR
jgi:hypothetical protein